MTIELLHCEIRRLKQEMKEKEKWKNDIVDLHHQLKYHEGESEARREIIEAIKNEAIETAMSDSLLLGMWSTNILGYLNTCQIKQDLSETNKLLNRKNENRIDNLFDSHKSNDRLCTKKDVDDIEE